MKTTLLFLSVFLTTSLFGQNVYIPDANFKAYLVGNPEINTNGDTEIQVSEASVFDGEISCVNVWNISDLTGIEAFTALTMLKLWGNPITSFDVSQNTALTKLDCWNNQLTSLDVSQNTALTYLDIADNQLTSLDVSQNTALEHLDCYDNQLTSLDVSQNTALEYLDCRNIQLTSLDVSQNIALRTLDCSQNQITSLDVSQNGGLWVFRCNYNQLTTLDVSQLTTLYTLWCEHNQLISLDLSQTAVTDCMCNDNQLTCLNVANGNQYQLQIEPLNNPNLTCVEVDDAEWATIYWSALFDPQTSFSEDCNNDCSSSTVGINELSTSKNLIQILDMMSRETTFKPNTPLIYVYDDGSTEKVFNVEY